MKFQFPELPDNQRWRVSRQSCFLVVSLQEKQWWGWRTIASGTGFVKGGNSALARCVKYIVDRDYYARLRAERDAEQAERRREIPYGTH